MQSFFKLLDKNVEFFRLRIDFSLKRLKMSANSNRGK